VTGGAGFIGSHLVDALIDGGAEVLVLDNLLSGYREQVNPKATFNQIDVCQLGRLLEAVHLYRPRGIFHCAALARTPWCIEEPSKAFVNNVAATAAVLEAGRRGPVARLVLCSSNVVYAADTPYKASKLMGEEWAKAYESTYGVNAISLRFSNVYGPRQSENGPSPNVFAALRKCLRENGYVEITGDGEQSRDFTHVRDIVRGLLAAMATNLTGTLDLCTGVNYTLNQVAKMFNAPVRYVAERPGDVKHIRQDAAPAQKFLGWSATISLPVGIRDCL